LGDLEKYLIVYFAGATGMWKGIPAGIALDLHPVLNGLLTAFGSITSVLILYFAGDKFRNWILKQYGNKRIERKKGKFMHLTDRYGPWGLGLITTGLLGPFTSLLLGLILIKNTQKFFIILLIGIVVWSLILAYLFTPLVEILFTLKDHV
jgi:membrane protein DedA with SNARE-associated domain